MKNVARWLLCVLLVCSAGSCSVNTNPEMPTWEAEFNVPLGTETTSLSEWVEESEDLYENASGVITFQFDGTLDRAEIGDRLTIDPITESFHQTIGVFELDCPERQQTELVFSSLWPPSQVLVGQTVPVPGFEFDNAEAPVPELDGFHSMTLDEGRITVVLRNLLPVAIENVSLNLVDEISSSVIVSFSFSSVPAGQADSTFADLAGRTLTNDLKVRASGGSPGSGLDPVYIDAGAGVAFEVGLSNLKALEASARLPATGIRLDETAEMSGGMVLTGAHIARGQLQLQFANELPVAVGGTFEIAEFRNPSGAPLVIEVHIPADEESSTEVVLDDYTFSAPAPAPGAPQILNIAAEVTTEDTGDIVTLSAEDGLHVEVIFDTLSFYQVSGILDGTSFDITPTTQEVDVLDDLEDISLQEARLVLKLVSSLSIPVGLSLEIAGQSDKGTIVTLPIEVELGPAPKSSSDTTCVILDQDNSTIVEFLNNIPSSITVTGEGRAGDGVTAGTVSQEDYVEGTYAFDVPFHLAFEEQSIETDLTEIEILPDSGDMDGGDNAIDGELTERMRSAEIWVTFQNHTPLGAAVTAYFAADSTRVFSDPDLVLDPVGLEPGSVDGSGRVVTATVCSNHLVLTEEDLDLFRNPGSEIKIVYFGTGIRLHSTGGQAVRICASDYFRTQARIRFTAMVEMPDDK
ncbi:MAG: hypothetical protein KAW17_11665 [Candidatus Eisenbacteria sp.]|nr:hypothetical protein [Candidatus Eisenbacteria bacterium]